jgi:hypothetical protein
LLAALCFLSCACSLAYKHNGNFYNQFYKNLSKICLSAIPKIAAFSLVGTEGGAIVCWYYSIPLGISILGDILALGIALALMSASIFD